MNSLQESDQYIEGRIRTIFERLGGNLSHSGMLRHMDSAQQAQQFRLLGYVILKEFFTYPKSAFEYVENILNKMKGVKFKFEGDQDKDKITNLKLISGNPSLGSVISHFCYEFFNETAHLEEDLHGPPLPE